MFVLIDVCCNERPIASATLINRLAKSVSNMGSGPSDVDATGVVGIRVVLRSRKVEKVMCGIAQRVLLESLRGSAGID